MAVTLKSFAKINLGLAIGPARADGFHELCTLYQPVALHDSLTLELRKGTGIEIECNHPLVPTDERNTCWRAAERVMSALKARGRVVITIDKRLPVEGGVGAGSSNAAVTIVGLERLLRRPLPADERMRIAAEVGSDVPLFLLGGAVLGLGRGEQVFALHDLPDWPCVLAMPQVRVSTAQAFAAWDQLARRNQQQGSALTVSGASGKINELQVRLCAWLSGSSTGVPVSSGGRAEALLLDLVRTGIENDFERVVFPQYPELRKVKRALERAGAAYAAMSGSGAAVFGLFRTRRQAREAAAELKREGIPAEATRLLRRAEYWQAVG